LTAPRISSVLLERRAISVRDFDYYRPRTLKEALQMISENQAKVLAGGTDLLVRMKDGLLRPESLVDISFLNELRYVREENGYVAIGALTTHAFLEGSPVIEKKAPHLAQAVRSIGSRQIRNMGSLGGNIVNASPAGDSIPPLYTLDAEFVLESLKGQRVVLAEEFFTGPGQTVLGKEELLTQVRFRPPEREFASFFLKVGQRKALAISKVSLAFLGVYGLDRKGFLKVRIALGAVAPTVIRARRAESFLQENSLTEEVIGQSRLLCSEEARPISDIRSTFEYRQKVAGDLLKKGLYPLIERVVS